MDLNTCSLPMSSIDPCWAEICKLKYGVRLTKITSQVNVIVPIQLIRGFPSKITRKIFKSLTSLSQTRKIFKCLLLSVSDLILSRSTLLSLNWLSLKKLMESAMQRDVHNKSLKMVCKKNLKAYLYYIESWNNTVINCIYAYYFLCYTLLWVLMTFTRNILDTFLVPITHAGD